MGEWQKAISVYEEMLELEYTKSFTYYKIGLCYKENKQPVLALNSFQKSLRDDPQFYLSMMEQSYIYEDMGGMKEALYFAKEAVSLNENNLDYQKRLAFLYIDSGRFEAVSYTHLYPSYFMGKKKIELTPGIDVDSLLTKMEKEYQNEEVSTVDGVKIDFEKNWVHLRKSNTEPIIRIYTEAFSQEEADDLGDRMIDKIKSLI